MASTISTVDEYLASGCGRCSLWNTPQCKVHGWRRELTALRSILLDCGLMEVLKWKVPCYTSGNQNIVIIGAFKEHCALSFFKGALLKDPQGIRELPGENSQAGRVIRFQRLEEIVSLECVLRTYIQEAVDVERRGLRVETKPVGEGDYPEELRTPSNTPRNFEKPLKRSPPAADAAI
ncbi:MAG: hypothetical protein RLZZ303_2734 [Candidatus Hydrogenedentota bacterium]|jgi:uncharacterized protein YdeI (YjbR/CyaY-like superfamily)